jgi:hypothetical protein
VTWEYVTPDGALDERREIHQGDSDLRAARPDTAAKRICSTVVLSPGMDQQLHVGPTTMAYLDEHAVEVHVRQAREALTIYNELADRVPVGDLFHSPC